MKAIQWNEEDQGMTFEVIPMPEDLKETVLEWREKLLEAVAEYDESLLEKFFEDPESITVEEVRNAVRDAVMDAAFVPMMCGSAFKNKGVQAVLDAVCCYLPSPVDIPPVKGTLPDDETVIVERAPSVDEPFAALAFKIATDPFVGRLMFLIPAKVLKNVSAVYTRCTLTSRKQFLA
jgi:elongation factor G